MRQALTILYSRIVIETLVIVGVLALIVGRIRRRLRVSPQQRSRAPMLWLVNFTADARLHRRLRQLAANARRAARGSALRRHRYANTSAQRLAIDVEAEIIVLDERLVDSRTLDFDAQRIVVKEIRQDADRVDMLTERVMAIVEAEATSPVMDVTGDPIEAITARVDQLEEAVRSGSANVIESTATSSAPADGSALDLPR